MIQMIQSQSNSKSYYCPYCKKLLIKGNIKSLNMPCPFCQALINEDEGVLLGSGESPDKHLELKWVHQPN